MKKAVSFITASCLILTLLAGCAPSASTTEPVSTTEAIAQTTLPETTAAPETTLPVTEAATQAATEAAAAYEPEITPVITGEQTQVHVKTADEFLAVLAPDTEIILDAELIDLSTVTGYGTKSSDYYYWFEEFDGPELYITNLSNLTIRGGGETHDDNVISAAPRYADVLNFENCSNIMVTGFTVGHAEEPGYCVGGVLKFINSQDILVQDCGLFGCGTWGVIGESSKNMQIVYNDIYDCSSGGIDLYNCDDVNADCNTFRNLGTEEFPGTEFRVYSCGKVTCNGEDLRDGGPRNMT